MPYTKIRHIIKCIIEKCTTFILKGDRAFPNVAYNN